MESGNSRLRTHRGNTSGSALHVDVKYEYDITQLPSLSLEIEVKRFPNMEALTS